MELRDHRPRMKPETVSVGPRHPFATVAKFVNVLVAAEGDFGRAVHIAEERAPAIPVLPKLFQKAAVGALPLSATDPYGFASEVFRALLVSNLHALLDRFVKVPPHVKIPVENNTGISAGWAGQGLPAPVLKSTSAVVTLDATKLIALSVLTRELFRFGVAAELFFMGLLRDAVSRFYASALFDPTLTATTSRPASLTNTAAKITSSGATAAQITTDLNTLIGLINTPMVDPAWIMRPKSFYRIAATLGGAGLNVSIADLFGIPVVTLSGMPQAVVLLDAASVLYASDDVAELSISTEAAIEMVDGGSSQSGITGTGAASLVSLYQSGLVGVQAEMVASWQNAFMLNTSPNVASGIAYMTTGY
jgi:hypothetical protein